MLSILLLFFYTTDILFLFDSFSWSDPSGGQVSQRDAVLRKQREVTISSKSSGLKIKVCSSFLMDQGFNFCGLAESFAAYSEELFCEMDRILSIKTFDGSEIVSVWLDRSFLDTTNNYVF